MDDLIPRGISHIQYADDTVIMLDCSDNSIRNLKLILYCFEWLSGLKINFHKTEVYVFSFEYSEKLRLANMLNCALTELPMKYLGIPVSDKILTINDFFPILQKINKKARPMEG